jgi:nitrate reductase assembly molybdenum cofactor insertion protein NarJ
MATLTVQLDQRAAYAGAAELFDYPSAATGEMIRQLIAAPPAWLEAASPELRTLFEQFARAIAAMPQGRWEELYAQTFDLQPELTLNMGHQIFGEDWKRSTLLIELAGLMPRHGIDCGTELPDYLPLLLRLFATAPASDTEVGDLRGNVALPALRTLSGKLAADNPYTPLLQALTLLLMQQPTGSEARS